MLDSLSAWSLKLSWSHEYCLYLTQNQSSQHKACEVKLTWSVRYSHRQKIISLQIIMWVFCSKLVIWSRIWCFTAKVKQMSMITKELYVLCLWESFHGYDDWMNWPDTDSALSLDDYFFNVSEQWVFISILSSVKLWLKLASKIRRKKEEVTERHVHIHTQYNHFNLIYFKNHAQKRHLSDFWLEDTLLLWKVKLSKY